MNGLDRIDRNILREVIMKAEDNKIITKEESGFIITLVEKFRNDIEKKIKQLHVLRGEINQLQANEHSIINLVNNMIAAEERNQARNKTIERIRGVDEKEVSTEDANITDDITKQ